MSRVSILMFSFSVALIATQCYSQAYACHHRGRGHSSNGCGGYSGHHGHHGRAYSPNVGYTSYGNSSSGCGCTGDQPTYYGMQTSPQPLRYTNGVGMSGPSQNMSSNMSSSSNGQVYYNASPATYGTNSAIATPYTGTSGASVQSSTSTNEQSPVADAKVSAGTNVAPTIASPPQPASLPMPSVSR